MKPVALLAAIVLLGGGCSNSKNPDKGVTAAQSVVAPDAHETFKARCAPCHGESGHGDGPGAAALTPKPRNYADVTWQGKVTDEQIKQMILYGGAAVGKSPTMPANPDLEGKPDLDGLVAIVRGFKGK